MAEGETRDWDEMRTAAILALIETATDDLWALKQFPGDVITGPVRDVGENVIS